MTATREGAAGRRRGVTGVALALALAATAGTARPAGAQQAETLDETRRVTRDVSVEIDVPVRHVRVRGWDREELRVRGEYVPRREEFEIEGGSASVEISLDMRGRRWEEDVEMPGELEVSVPRGARLSVEVQAGAIDVEGVHGDVSLETVSGDVTYTGEASSVGLGSVSGSVTADAPGATTTRAESVSGDVRVAVAGGLVDVEAVSGDVDVRASGTLTRLQVESVSGRIRVDAAPAANASFALESHSGAVELGLPADLDAVLEAGTFSGVIRNAFGQEARRTDRYTPGMELRQTVGGGSARISVETFSGGIDFSRRGGGAS